MKRIGVTGHRVIPEGLLDHVRARLWAVLDGHEGPLEALSSLADGADQIFADLALARGAELTAVIPSADYAETFNGPRARARYQALLDRAGQEVRLPYPTATDAAYYAAGAYIVDGCDRLVAVWDGRPARGHGGTAEIVAYARGLGKPVTVIWGEGFERP
ncbi:hypothetical protein ACN20G_21895 [Streptomyces sp. BI20]|uniref:hypothetical protein n=1 Tax=Streptomyces sp. BI20 TaxID=3403460 RepID=UPI003C72F786